MMIRLLPWQRYSNQNDGFKVHHSLKYFLISHRLFVVLIQKTLFPRINASPYLFFNCPLTYSSVCSSAMFIYPSKQARTPKINRKSIFVRIYNIKIQYLKTFNSTRNVMEFLCAAFLKDSDLSPDYYTSVKIHSSKKPMKYSD